MFRVKISRWINFYLLRGKKDQMVSSRIHQEQWRCEPMLDRIFFWHKQHCRGAHLWERKYKDAQ